jgi:2-oxoisovalerate dehydrogenase E1 component
LKTDRVSVCFFGDGAVSNGAFHEGVNLAAIWDLPVVFVCENNRYATEVAFDYATRNTNVAERARSYGIPGVEVDGNDVIAIYEVAGAAVERARRGGPTLIEAKTYRTRPHAEGMRDGGYRTLGMVARGLAAEADFAAIDAEIQSLVAEALTFAAESPYPEPATAADYIYSEDRR